MKKTYIIVIIGLIVIIGGLAGIKVLQIRAMIDQGKNFVLPPEVVTSVSVKADSWESVLTAVGSLDAVQGVTITAEITGKVSHINFEAGSRVKAGDLLVQQDMSVEKAQLREAESVSALARIEYERTQQLFKKKIVPRSNYDNAKAQLAQAIAQEDNIRAVIAKKNLRAPFAGRLGIRQINLGQVINEGQAVVTLQSLESLFVNFYLPQQKLSLINTGLKARVTSDALPDKIFTCSITAINPKMDAVTRNIQIQALLNNPKEQLRPGMYVNVAVILPKTKDVMTIPATAVLYAPYSDSVFVIEDKKDEKGMSEGKLLRQQFVRLGEKRGDFISVISGLKPDDVIVSTGVFKLRNGQSVVVDNKLAPEFKLSPEPEES